MSSDQKPFPVEFSPRSMWFETDGSQTFMSRARGGVIQCFSNEIDPSACGLNLAGPFHGTTAIPEKLISEDLTGNHPFYLAWSNGDMTNLSHLNGIFLKRILKIRKALKVQWRPDPDNVEITFSFTIPVKRASLVIKNSH